MDLSSVTKHFPTANAGFVTTTNGEVNSATATSVPINSIAGLTNGSVFVGIISPGISEKEQVFTGTVNTATYTIEDVVFTDGPTGVHSTGATVVDRVTTTLINMMSKGFLEEHEQDGTHKDTITTAFMEQHNADGTHKRVARQPMVTSASTASSITPNADTTEVYTLTALASNLTINAPTGTPYNGQSLVIRIKDNGTARSLTWNAIFKTMGVTLPTTTTAGKKMYVGATYDSATNTWDVVGVGRE